MAGDQKGPPRGGWPGGRSPDSGYPGGWTRAPLPGSDRLIVGDPAIALVEHLWLRLLEIIGFESHRGYGGHAYTGIGKNVVDIGNLAASVTAILDQLGRAFTSDQAFAAVSQLVPIGSQAARAAFVEALEAHLGYLVEHGSLRAVYDAAQPDRVARYEVRPPGAKSAPPPPADASPEHIAMLLFDVVDKMGVRLYTPGVKVKVVTGELRPLTHVLHEFLYWLEQIGRPYTLEEAVGQGKDFLRLYFDEPVEGDALPVLDSLIKSMLQRLLDDGRLVLDKDQNYVSPHPKRDPFGGF